MPDKDDLKGFNQGQKQAILSPLGKDVLISAGAGSGKTKTLSEKVARMIKEGEIKPSELLILTFTNNAAHEMKQRIMSYFKDDKDLQAKMISCHIQTFDSFNQYLVSLYADRLGISPSVNIVDSAFFEVMKKKTLEEILMTLYEDENSREKALDVFSKFDTVSDKNSKVVIESLYGIISKYSPSEIKQYRSILKNQIDNPSFFKKIYDDYIVSLKKQIEDKIKLAYLKETTFTMSIPEMREFLSNKSTINLKMEDISFRDQEIATPLFQSYLELLKLEGEEFLTKCLSFKEEHSDLSAKRITEKKLGIEKGDPIQGYRDSLSILKSILLNKDSILSPYLVASYKENQEHFKKSREDILYLLDIAIELDKRMKEYKKKRNAFSYDDVSLMALSLLEDDPEIGKKIRKRFKYVMVDEYQDTDPGQERFFDALLKEEDGTRSHLFAVGDPKQSIYLFNGSKVELFLKREEEYSKDGNDASVIHMNHNYRSGEKLLSEINAVFKKYLRKNHGGIDYSLEREQLKYDHAVNLYDKPYEGFGIYRILPDNLSDAGMFFGNAHTSDNASWEANAIAKDIQEKVGVYQVYDRSIKGLRPARYSDFCILVRRIKSNTPVYQKAFEMAGIPLNVKKVEDMGDDDPFILIRSICGILSYFLKDEEDRKGIDLRHLYASVLRSYAFRYGDHDIHDILKWDYKDKEKANDYSYLLGDPLLLKFEQFAHDHASSSFHTIFLDLIDEFGVVEKLTSIGNVAVEMSKIDAIYEAIISQEKLGEGLEGFIDYLDNLDIYRIGNESESLISNEDSVEMMSIHASKGLEKKIVYLPVTGNDDRGAPEGSTTVYKDDFPYLLDLTPNGFQDIAYISAKEDPRKEKEETDDHVRLFYVAFTRAENSIYVVGNPKFGNESLYDCLTSGLDGHKRFDDDFIRFALDSKILDQSEIDAYSKQCDESSLNDRELPDLSSLDEERKGEYLELMDSLLRERKENILSESFEFLVDKSYEGLISILSKECEDIDLVARLYGSAFGLKCEDYLSLVAKLHQMKQLEKEEEDDSDPSGGIKPLSEMVDTQGNEELRDMLDALDKGLTELEYYMNERVQYFLPSPKTLSRYIEDNPFSLVPPQYFFYRNIMGPRFDEEDFKGYLERLSKEWKGQSDSIRLYFGYKKKITRNKEKIEKSKDYPEYFRFLCSAIAGIAHPYGLALEGKDYEDKVVYSHIEEVHRDYIKPEVPEAKIDDREILFPEIATGRASKKHVKESSEDEEEYPWRELAELGNRLHRYFELIDLKNPDASFIKDEKDRKAVEKALNKIELLRPSKDAKVYKEFGYFDPMLGSSGFIDLLIVEDDVYKIIDYKTSNISDPAYALQLHAYKRNVARLFSIPEEKIKTYLVSIFKCESREVE